MPICIIGLIVLVFSVAAFFLLSVDKIAVNIWALVFLLLSEIVFFSGLIGLRFTKATHSSFFLKTGITTSLSLYFTATFISVLFAGFFRENINTFILIEISIIVLFAIVSISFFAFSRRIDRQGDEDLEKVGENEPKRGGF